MAWSDAITQLGKAWNKGFDYLFGGQSRQERRLEDEADRLEHLWHATRDPADLDDLNRVRAELRRVRNRAAARKL